MKEQIIPWIFIYWTSRTIIISITSITLMNGNVTIIISITSRTKITSIEIITIIIFMNTIMDNLVVVLLILVNNDIHLHNYHSNTLSILFTGTYLTIVLWYLWKYRQKINIFEYYSPTNIPIITYCYSHNIIINIPIIHTISYPISVSCSYDNFTNTDIENMYNTKQINNFQS